jgi:predicted XRE-type DNA-binding protein
MIEENNNSMGSNFDDFLTEEGIFEEVEAIATKRVIAFQLEAAMKVQHITKAKMAEKMHTSRSTVNRLFDPENQSVTLLTLERAASALGKRLKLDLV